MNPEILTQKNKYNDLKEYLYLILNELNKCIESLENSSVLAEKYYLIDNISKEKNEIIAKAKELTKMRDDLKNIVIPQIEEKIVALSQ